MTSMRDDPASPPALEELGFQYQPVAPISPGVLGWHEALVRWHLADGTIRGPLDVLPYWLGPHRQPAFTRFTVEQAASRLQGDAHARLSINLSPRQVTHPAALAALESLLPAVRGRLIVEITEQQHRRVSQLRSSLEALSERCHVVLLDDVSVEDLLGSGRVLEPVDGIKLDRSVLLALGDDDRRVALAKAVRDHAERFPIVVAEGIEHPAQVAWLAGMGVTHLQGFAIGKPAERLEAAIWQPDLRAADRDEREAPRTIPPRYRRG